MFIYIYVNICMCYIYIRIYVHIYLYVYIYVKTGGWPTNTCAFLCTKQSGFFWSRAEIESLRSCDNWHRWKVLTQAEFNIYISNAYVYTYNYCICMLKIMSTYNAKYISYSWVFPCTRSSLCNKRDTSPSWYPNWLRFVSSGQLWIPEFWTAKIPQLRFKKTLRTYPSTNHNPHIGSWNSTIVGPHPCLSPFQFRGNTSPLLNQSGGYPPSLFQVAEHRASKVIGLRSFLRSTKHTRQFVFLPWGIMLIFMLPSLWCLKIIWIDIHAHIYDLTCISISSVLDVLHVYVYCILLYVYMNTCMYLSMYVLSTQIQTGSVPAPFSAAQRHAKVGRLHRKFILVSREDSKKVHVTSLPCLSLKPSTWRFSFHKNMIDIQHR